MTYIAIVLFCAFAADNVYVRYYFRSENFTRIKNRVKTYVDNCNQLNEHIDDLRSAYAEVRKLDLGDAKLSNTSRYNMRRAKWAEIRHRQQTHRCSSSVVKNAADQPFKYLCKYFDIEISEASVSQFESVFNAFSAAKQGRVLLLEEKREILNEVSRSVPWLITSLHSKRLIRGLGFFEIDLTDMHHPIFTFQYVSAGGNSSSESVIELNTSNLERLIAYLGARVRFRTSVAGQRALMTSSLREAIKARDGFTCRTCKLSAHTERNLLLEIDHIIPLSKGGITAEDNLQTLCWKCNRKKGSKIIGSRVELAMSSPASIANGRQTSISPAADRNAFAVDARPAIVRRWAPAFAGVTALCVSALAHAAAPHKPALDPDAELPAKTGLVCEGVEVTDSDPVRTAPHSETLYLNLSSSSWSDAGHAWVAKFVSLDANRIVLEKTDRAQRWLNRRTLAYWHLQPAAEGDGERAFAGRCRFTPWQPTSPLKL